MDRTRGDAGARFQLLGGNDAVPSVESRLAARREDRVGMRRALRVLEQRLSGRVPPLSVVFPRPLTPASVSSFSMDAECTWRGDNHDH